MLSKVLVAICLICLPSAGYGQQKTAGENAQIPPVYVLQVGDKVSLSVYQEEDLSKTVTVDRSGNASFNLIGEVELVGKTLKQAEEYIAELYKKDFLVNPIINLEMDQYVARWIIIVGDITSPGTVDLGRKQQMKLSSCFTKAGGVPGGSTRGNFLIERLVDGKVETYPLSKADSVYVSHGDMVTVRLDQIVKQEEEDQRFITLAGHINRPGRLAMPREGKLDIITAIAEAGGFTGIANRRDITVKRPSNGGFRTIELNMNKINAGKSPMFHVQEGDIIIVKERFF